MERADPDHHGGLQEEVIERGQRRIAGDERQHGRRKQDDARGGFIRAKSRRLSAKRL